MRTESAALLVASALCAFVLSAWTTEAATYTEKVLYSFCNKRHCKDGAYPSHNLVYASGTLYGLTSGGGHSGCIGAGCGTVYSLNPRTGREKVLYSFCSQTNCADGWLPSSLIELNGTLYGTTNDGGVGTNGSGVAFALDPAARTEMVLYSFCQQTNCSDGSNPTSLTAANSTLYGTSQTGGAANFGTIFSLDSTTGAEKVIYSFCSQPKCTDGLNPDAAMLDMNSVFYGTTAGGGESAGCGNGCGTVYAFNQNTGAETVLYSFCSQVRCADGTTPETSLLALNGKLYGTALFGGSTNCHQGCGTVFSVDLNTGAEALLYSFLGGTDGAMPYAGLTAVNGTLYGTTEAGGTGCNGGGCGTIFSINPKTGAETVLYSFCSQPNCTDGAAPTTALIAANSKFYGTTDEGGTFGGGTVFVLKKVH